MPCRVQAGGSQQVNSGRPAAVPQGRRERTAITRAAAVIAAREAVPRSRYVAVSGAGQRIVGYGGLWPVRPGKFRIDLVVAPGYRRRGIGGWLLDGLTSQARAAGAATVQARADSDWAQALAFLRHRGFSETMRMHRLVLDVASDRAFSQAGMVVQAVA